MKSIGVDWEKANIRNYYQTVNLFTKGFQPRLNACKDNSEKLIEGMTKY
jgi:hypothetical protein